MKESGLQPTFEQVSIEPAPQTLDAENAEGRLPEQDLRRISRVVENIRVTTPQSLPRTKDMIMRGDLTSPREAGIPFYTAAKVLEGMSKKQALPPIAEARMLAVSQARERTPYASTDSFEDTLQKISENNPYEAVVLQRPWTGVVQGIYSDMFHHLPVATYEQQFIEAAKGTESLGNDGDSYSESLWREIFALGEIETLGEKVLTGQTYMNSSDYDAMLHTSISLMNGEGKQVAKVSQGEVEAIVTQRVREDIGDDPQRLIQNRSTSMLYEHLTGEPLWDYRATEPVADFFMAYARDRKMYLNWHKNPEVRPDAMFEAFVGWVNPHSKEYPLNKDAKMKMPSEQVNAFVASQEHVKVIDVDAYLELDQKLEPLLSNMLGRPVDVPEFSKKLDRLLFKINTSGNVIERTFKTPEEVIASVFEEIGVTDPYMQFQMLAHSESELQGWLGAHKHEDLASPQENNFKQGLAIKLFLDTELLKAGIEKNGWIPEEASEGGLLGSIAQYFKENPAEWAVRNYGELGEDWNTGHIEQPKPHNIFGDLANDGALEAYKPWRSESERYLVGAKNLIEQGEIPGVDTSLQHLLTHELYPIHQMFAATDQSVDDLRAVFERKMGELPNTLSPLERVREVSKQLRSELEFNTFKTRYEAQYEIDTQLSDRIMQRIMEHTQGREIETGLTKQILEIDCGDSRNEARRVALENTSNKIATIGAAGHFGIPYDQISPVLEYTEREKISVKDRLRKLRTKNGLPSQAEVKKMGAEGVEMAEETWESFKHTSEVPAFLAGASAVAPELVTSLYAGQLTNLVLGSQLEHISPGLHQRMQDRKEASLGEVTYRLDVSKADVVEYKRVHDEIARLTKLAIADGLTDKERIKAEADITIYEHDARNQIGADFVEGLLTMTNLDVTKWLPESNEPKLLALGGHKAKVHENNLDFMAYECGACGGHSGERNAQVMADLINNTDVRDILRSRGIDLKNIYAIGGVYNTTTSEMKWHISDSLANNEELKPLLEELQSATEVADTEARMLHEEYLKGSIEYSLINKVKSKTVWRGKSKEEQDKLAVLSNAYERSVNAGEVQPEGGNGWSGAVIYGNREYLRGVRADEISTTFHVNAAMGDMIPAAPIDVFAGVYAGIRNTYYEGDLNKADAPYKAQQDWNFTGSRIWALNSAGDRDVVGSLSRQMFNGRKIPATRPNYQFIAPMETVLQRIEETPQLKQILDLGYGMATAYTDEGVYRYVSPAHKFIVDGAEAEGTWEPVAYLNNKRDVKAHVDETPVFEMAHVRSRFQ